MKHTVAGRLLPALALVVLLASCSKQEADITIHYNYINESGFDLKLKPAGGSSYDLPADVTLSFTDITGGVDYRGSCSFRNVFEGGGVLTIAYKDKEYDYDIVHSYDYGAYVGIRETDRYKIHKDAPREYTLSYTFTPSEIVNVLNYLGVWDGSDMVYTNGL